MVRYELLGAAALRTTRLVNGSIFVYLLPSADVIVLIVRPIATRCVPCLTNRWTANPTCRTAVALVALGPLVPPAAEVAVAAKVAAASVATATEIAKKRECFILPP
jgi:hypothetical protein